MKKRVVWVRFTVEADDQQAADRKITRALKTIPPGVGLEAEISNPERHVVEAIDALPQHSTREILMDALGALPTLTGPRTFGHNPSWVKVTDLQDVGVEGTK